ncbi:radical SAM protein [Malonomonas rubra]|uniref:radical SAM protein n=1 Tax=Malonomonas rubra TaxID=57040 RepID=UPI0026EEB4D8|nr:radical SAM protein [Malonomonas rubra]
MYVSRDELLWMLRQIYGQRIEQEKLIRKFRNHGISSLLPYFNEIESIFNKLDDKFEVAKKAVRSLAIRINCEIDDLGNASNKISYLDLENQLLPILIRSLNLEHSSSLEKGARISVRLDSGSCYAKPGSEGFIIEKSAGVSKVKFYSTAGRYGLDIYATEIPDEELQVLTVDNLLARHKDIRGVAQYFFNDSMLRAMKTSIDSSVYSFTANLAVNLLIDKGFLKIEGDEFVGVLEQIFPVLAPKMAKTYRDISLFSSPTLSSPPSERKAHVLRLELTTGCDYNRCTFCSEYADKTFVTKSFDEFKEHVNRVVVSIESEKSRIQRLFIGSGNSLGVDTELLLRALNYASNIFNPQKISLYGRTASILAKSVDELKELKEAGLTLIYWGLESGSDEVLNYICKDCTRDEIIAAAKKLVKADIEVSAMLMPGVGGLKFSQQHVVGTLELLHNINIKYLTLLSINPSEYSLYERNMQSEIDNRHLTPDEVNAQVYQLLEGLKPTGLQIGMFTEEIDQASSNTKRFSYPFTDANKELLLREFWN